MHFSNEIKQSLGAVFTLTILQFPRNSPTGKTVRVLVTGKPFEHSDMKQSSLLAE
jgi:hypothetical protein